jgi:putative endonuclease
MTFLMRKQLGVWGESTAEQYLKDNGIQIIHKNFRTRYGEIDLIAKENETFLFVEVKTRQSERFGFPEDAVTDAKLDRMEIVISEFFEQFDFGDIDWRIDIISIIRNPQTEKFELNWIKNVVA